MEQTNEYHEVKGNRNVKSSLFAKIFSDKKELLELFNAVNGTNHQDTDELEINTIEGIVYMTTKNDVSFLIDSAMNLYEQQSTYNPNMPIRGVKYFGQLYNKYIKTNGLNIYSSKLQQLPVPHYVVFYNGTKEEPDEKILRLSDAFMKGKNGERISGCLECKVRMLNINYGHNKTLMEKCQRLKEYAIFVGKLREYAKEFPNQFVLAITKAIDECIAENVLRDFLMEKKSEVLEMLDDLFDKELYEKDLKQIAYEEGEQIGRQQGIQQGIQQGLIDLVKKKHEKGQTIEEIADALEESVDVIRKMVAELQ